MRGWTIRDSLELYSVSNWGAGYFSINERGSLSVQPRLAEGPSVDLLALVEDLGRRGLRTPLLIRFPDILASRLEALSGAFQSAIQEYDYSGRYLWAYKTVNKPRCLT